MKKTKPEAPPALVFQLEVREGSLVIHLSGQMRWVAATLAILSGLLMGTDALRQVLEVLTRLPR